MLAIFNYLIELSAEKADDGDELSSVGHAPIKKLRQCSESLNPEASM
jgi:hypothetical protein